MVSLINITQTIANYFEQRRSHSESVTSFKTVEIRFEKIREWVDRAGDADLHSSVAAGVRPATGAALLEARVAPNRIGSKLPGSDPHPS
jgi:hypothetical protein